MRSRSFLALALALLCLLPGAAAAAEVDCDSVYCFTAQDFSAGEGLAGICITDLPEARLGTVMLGSRTLMPGDILAADQLAQITFVPVRTEDDLAAQVGYLPIYEAHVAPSAVMTIAIRGKEDKAPAAEDFAAETYKNLPLEGKLKVKDPEGEAMTYTLKRSPKRGDVELRPDGSFTYTPKKNKVGIDSFVYTASDPAGNESREATVTITIVKPADATQYTDTAGKSCRFAAEWMKNTGIFVGESLDGNACFQPEKEVTRGEFLAMAVKTLEIPLDAQTVSTESDQVPQWLRPYLAAAVRSGLVAGLPEADFDAAAPISGSEAAVMLQNALKLTVSADAEVFAGEEGPDWAQASLEVLAANGLQIAGEENLDRSDAAQILYRASKLAANAPGMILLRKQ